MLVHMSPREVESLQALAKANGGTLTINPNTGLPEAGFLDSLLPIAAGFLLGPAGFGIASSALGAGAIVGGITTLATGSLQKGLMAGFGAYGGAGLGAGLAGVGESALGTEAYNTAMANTIEPGLEGITQREFVEQSVADRIKDATPWEKLSAGFNASTASPTAAWDFAKNNGQALLAATSPVLAGSGVQTTTSAPQTPSYYRPFMYDPQTQGLQALTPVSGKGIKEGGLTGLCGGGAVAFADGGSTTMVSPYINAIEHPETIPLMSGETQEQGLARVQAQQQELDERNKRRMEAAGQQAPATIDYTQSPAGLNAANPTVQTEADREYWRQRGAGMAGSGFTTGSADDSGNAQRQNAYIQSLMANNPAPVGPTNAQRQYDAQLEQARTRADREAVAQYHPAAPTGGDFQISAYLSPDEAAKTKAISDALFEKYKPAPLTPMPGTSGGPAAGDASMSRAQGIQTLTKPDTPATTTAAPSGIQLVHGSIYDPATGRFRNPTEAELGTQALRGMRDNVNTVNEMTQLTNQYFDSYKPGEVLDFAGGTLTKNADGTATHKYTDANGKTQSYTFTKGTDIATIAKSDPAIAGEWKNMFNYTVPTPSVVTPPVIGTTPVIKDPSIPIGGGGNPGKSTTRPFDWQNVPIDRLPTVAQKKPEEAMSGESLAAYNALFGKGSTATKQWDTYPGRNYLPNTNRNFFYQRNGEATSSNTAGVDPSSLTNPKNPPVQSPGVGKEWYWAGDKWGTRAVTPDVGDSDSRAANGGLMGYAAGGLGSLGGYSDGGSLLRGPGDGVSDSIPASIGDRQPARLADGEFVVPARIVSELGNGSTEAGARRLYQMMDRVQHARKKSVGKGNVAKNTRAEQYLPA
jgi:hypothetical protein